MPLQGLVLLLAPKSGYALPQLFHKGICRLLRVQVTIHGTPSPEKTNTLCSKPHFLAGYSRGWQSLKRVFRCTTGSSRLPLFWSLLQTAAHYIHITNPLCH